MPRRKSLRYTPQPPEEVERQRREVTEGRGFYAPIPPHPDHVRAYLSLYLMERQEWDEAPELGVLRAAYTGQVDGYPLPIPPATTIKTMMAAHEIENALGGVMITTSM